MSDKKATLTFDGKTIELDSLTGTENETGLDIINFVLKLD